jgi:D-beta-D-heptose 7-phosphate kinase/D-beta-D-heptose 1-phosphate adenosyltransferase
MLRLDFEESFSGEDHTDLISRFEQLAKDCDLVVFSDYAKGTLAEVTAMIATARSYGKPTLVDPKGSDFDKYRNTDLLTPNFSEFSVIVGEIENEEMLHAKAKALHTR